MAQSSTLLDRLAEMESGTQLTLDRYKGTWTVVGPTYEPTGNSVVGVRLLDEDLNQYELRTVPAGGFDLRPEDDNAPVRAVPERDQVMDVEVIGHDKTPLKNFERQMWGA